MAMQFYQDQASPKYFAVSYRIIPQNHPEYRANAGYCCLQIYKHFRWGWESFRQRSCNKWPTHDDLLFFYNTSCSDLIPWELALLLIRVDFLPLFGRDNTTSGLAQYQVNSNFTSEQLILRDSFLCRQLKANKSPFFCLFVLNSWEKSSYVPVEEVDQSQSASHWVT